MKKAGLIAALVLISAACGPSVPAPMTNSEKSLINDSPEVMRILSYDNEKDSDILRSLSTNLNFADICSPEYKALVSKMISTLEQTDGGVGLAAPQIGLNRRVVAVMRVDKEGEPIEVYPNIRIVEMRGDPESGSEGCLSVPDRRGDVLRSQDITIAYTDISSDCSGQPKEIREDISGFAAVIFQHEVDHLDGILYIDKLQ